jgi:hydrogenase/urease accessory protein HupE
VRNNGATCAPESQRPAHHDPRTDKVFVSLLYRCGRPLGVVTLRTGLFDGDPTPHQVLGTFRHKRALENYLLTPGASEAVIDTARLAQVGPAEATRPGQIRVVTPPPGAFDGEAALPAHKGVSTPIGSGFGAFFLQGIRHILGGLDHVLFVIALVSVATSWRDLAKVVTSFTLAHSLTLALGALDLVRLSPRLVEPLIAASIVYVAVENVARSQPRARIGVTFGFGLVHGFGFSGVLRDLGLAKASLLSALVGFNLGVETGQLLIVAPLAPLVWWLHRRLAAYRRVRLVANALVALVAGWWFVQRIATAA